MNWWRGEGWIGELGVQLFKLMGVLFTNSCLQWGFFSPNYYCPRSSDPFYLVTYYIKWVTLLLGHIVKLCSDITGYIFCSYFELNFFSISCPMILISMRTECQKIYQNLYYIILSIYLQYQQMWHRYGVPGHSVYFKSVGSGSEKKQKH